MMPNRPESCVEVVDATTIDLSWASAGSAAGVEAENGAEKKMTETHGLDPPDA